MTKSEKEIKHYLTKFKKGDVKAYNKLYEECYDYFRQIAAHYLNNKNDIQDCLQNAFIKIYRYIKSFNTDNDAFNWIYTIIKHEAFTMNAQYKMLVGLSEDYDISDKHDDINDFIEMEAIKSLFKNYEPLDFKIFYLKQFEFYSFAEISEKTGLTKSGVYKRYKKVLSEILKKYEQSGERFPKIQSILNIKQIGDHI